MPYVPGTSRSLEGPEAVPLCRNVRLCRPAIC
jgi:hypothetical protein